MSKIDNVENVAREIFDNINGRASKYFDNMDSVETHILKMKTSLDGYLTHLKGWRTRYIRSFEIFSEEWENNPEFLVIIQIRGKDIKQSAELFKENVINTVKKKICSRLKQISDNLETFINIFVKENVSSSIDKPNQFFQELRIKIGDLIEKYNVETPIISFLENDVDRPEKQPTIKETNIQPIEKAKPMSIIIKPKQNIPTKIEKPINVVNVGPNIIPSNVTSPTLSGNFLNAKLNTAKNESEEYYVNLREQNNLILNSISEMKNAINRVKSRYNEVSSICIDYETSKKTIEEEIQVKEINLKDFTAELDFSTYNQHIQKKSEVDECYNRLKNLIQEMNDVIQRTKFFSIPEITIETGSYFFYDLLVLEPNWYYQHYYSAETTISSSVFYEYIEEKNFLKIENLVSFVHSNTNVTLSSSPSVSYSNNSPFGPGKKTNNLFPINIIDSLNFFKEINEKSNIQSSMNEVRSNSPKNTQNNNQIKPKKSIITRVYSSSSDDFIDNTRKNTNIRLENQLPKRESDSENGANEKIYQNVKNIKRSVLNSDSKRQTQIEDESDPVPANPKAVIKKKQYQFNSDYEEEEKEKPAHQSRKDKSYSQHQSNNMRKQSRIPKEDTSDNDKYNISSETCLIRKRKRRIITISESEEEILKPEYTNINTYNNNSKNIRTKKSTQKDSSSSDSNLTEEYRTHINKSREQSSKPIDQYSTSNRLSIQKPKNRHQEPIFDDDSDSKPKKYNSILKNRTQKEEDTEKPIKHSSATDTSPKVIPHIKHKSINNQEQNKYT